MLPMYMAESYEAFYSRFSDLPDNEKLSMIKEAALFVELTKDEVECLLCFCTDSNGIPYEPANMKGLTPDRMVDIIVAVCFEIGRIKIDLVSADEKKKLITSQSMYAGH